jgi:hypothetical protein
MIIWCMRIACWIPKTTNTHSGYVILIAPLNLCTTTGYDVCKLFAACSLPKAAAAAATAVATATAGRVVMTDEHGALVDRR